jgi:hypothetical protein
MSVEEFVTSQSAGAPVDGSAAGEQKGAPKAKGWLIAAIVVAVGLLWQARGPRQRLYAFSIRTSSSESPSRLREKTRFLTGPKRGPRG